MNLFAYGTLTFPEVWQRIDVGPFESVPAVLPGFAIFRVRNAVFPGIIRGEPGDHVSGLVFRGLLEEDLFELEAYESDLYDRIDVIAASDQGPLECSAFVIPESHRSALTNEFWDTDQFKKHQLAKYVSG